MLKIYHYFRSPRLSLDDQPCAAEPIAHRASQRLPSNGNIKADKRLYSVNWRMLISALSQLQKYTSQYHAQEAS